MYPVKTGNFEKIISHIPSENRNFQSLSKLKSDLVIVDSKLDNYQELVSGVKAGFEVIAIAQVGNAIEQITEILNERSNINSIHIVSHGQEAALKLGRAELNIDNLETYSSQLQQWGKALSESGSILLYGCNIAAGESGMKFVQKLSEITGANIAASNNLTGSAALGGDWELEITTGQINVELAFEKAVLESYPSVLATLVTEDFKKETVIGPWTYGKATGSANPGLTAGAASNSGVLPNLGNNDPTGTGALRLTSNAKNQAAFVIYNTPISATGGVRVTFDFFTYNISADSKGRQITDVNGDDVPGQTGPLGEVGGDGTSFFLIDGTATPTQAGGFGGSLGYAQRINTNPALASAGLAGGYLGIGLDEFGFFSTTSGGKVGGAKGVDERPNVNYKEDSVAVRGSQINSYNFLTHAVVPFGIDGKTTDNTNTTIRSEAKRSVQITLLPATSPTPNRLSVAFDLNNNGSFDASETLIDIPNLTLVNGAVPPTLKFGFAASTGQSTNIHEVNNILVERIDEPTANQPPVTKNTSGSVLPGNTLGVTGLGGTDPDGSIASYKIDTLPLAAQGVLFLGDPANGGVLVTAGQKLTPAQIDQLFFKSTGVFTEAKFTYTATDNQGLSSSTPATATLTAANQPPITKNTSGSVLPGNTLGVTGLGGTDPDGSIKSFTINTLPPATEGVLFLGDPANGGVLVTAGQVLTPAEIDKLFFKSTGAFTEANFTYTATDNQGLSSSTPATATLTAANQPPVIKNTSGSVLPGNTLRVTGLEGTDLGGSIASYKIDTLPLTTEGVLFLGDPANGGVAVTAGKVLTPAQIDQLFFKSTGAFTEAKFTYTATDNQGLSSPTPATATLTAANQPPVINNANAVVAPNSTVPLPGLGGTDPDGSIASFTINTLPPATQGVLFLGDPANGGVAVTPGRVLKPEQIGQLFFRTTGDFTGANFSYSATDSSGASSSATATLGATSTPIPIPIPIPIPTPTPTPNQPPVATNANLSISPNSSTPITGLGGIDRDGSIASFTINTLPPAAQGVLFLGDPANGGIAVTPGQVLTPAQIGQLFFRTTGDFTGANFSYSATDSSGATSPATATLAATSTPISTPTPLNQAPVANNLNLTIPPNSSTPITGLGGTDPDGSIASFTITTLPPTAQGVLFLGDPALGGGVPVTVAQTITPEQIGQLFFRTTGEFTGANFSYSATDNNGATSPATATVAAVLPTPNQPPLATNANLSIPPNSTTRVTGLGGTDPDGSIASFTITTLPPTAQGILFLGDPANGGVAVTPGQVLTPSQIGQLFFRTTGEFTGANFSYSATDNNGATSPATATVATVPAPASNSTQNPTPTPTPNPLNEPPVSTNVNFSIPPNSSTRVTGLGGTDTDGSIASFTINTLPPSAQGVLFLGDPANGGIAVTPGQVLTPAQIGQLFFRTTGEFTGANFTYSATDNQGATSPATATVAALLPTSNQPPVATNTNLSIAPNSTTPVTGLSATDPDGTIAFFTINTLPPAAQGTLFLGDPALGGGVAVTVGQTITPERIGQLFFQATANFTGGTFTYSATDNNGATSPGSATVAAILRPVLPTPTPTPSPEPDMDCGCDSVVEKPEIRFLPATQPPEVSFNQPGVPIAVEQQTLKGTNGNDSILGGNANEKIIGFQGGDLILGEGGTDEIYGDEGNDIIFGGLGSDVVYGGENNDLILAGKGNDWIAGELGSDTILGDRGADTILGDTGQNNSQNLDDARDLIFGGDSADVINGNEGDDTIHGGKGNDIALGGKNKDLILGEQGSDTLIGGSGDDSLFGGNLDNRAKDFEGRDVLYGGDGNDFLNGQEGDDTLISGKNDDRAYGGKGNDLIFGQLGSDTLYGNEGIDTILGDSGSFEPVGDAVEQDLIFGGTGGDIIGGGNGNDTVYAGKGSDYVWGGKDNDLIWGELGNDTLLGDSGDDTLYGGVRGLVKDTNGKDLLLGNIGSDLLFGDESDDTISGGKSNDSLFGGKGNDFIHGDQDDDLIYGGDGSDVLCGDDGNDTIYGDRADDKGVSVGSTEQQDCINGGAGNDLIYGNEGEDELNGEAGNDTLYGGKDNDILFGGEGDDILFGGSGDNTLSGGVGSDQFILGANGLNTILNFEVGIDKLVLTGGLTFQQLQFTSTQNGTLLRVVGTGQVLANLVGGIGAIGPNDVRSNLF
ncbi:MAG: DUF4347 domain-containing protein [Tychonema bourrellyi B0820]|nr:DUF4347 domain-containing protein [Tychonema bourrellyi B0820]